MDRKHILPVVCMVALLACKKEEAERPDLGFGYVPKAVGTWVEYQVDSMWRDDRVGVRDSVSYRLLERIMEHYTDNEGRACQRIHRYVRDANGQWVIRDVWTATADSYAAERTEENVRRLKLSFPIREDRVWDMNIYANGTEEDPEEDDELLVGYEAVDEPWSAQGLDYSRTVLVQHTVPANFIDRRDFQERYAHDVGLVAKHWEETNTQSRIVNGLLVIEVKGWRLDMVAVAYGAD